MNETIPAWRIEALIKTLKEIVSEDSRLVEKYPDACAEGWLQGRCAGYAMTAKWLEKIVEKNK